MATVFCPACGQPSPVGTSYCPKCGTAIPMTAAASSPPPATPTPPPAWGPPPAGGPGAPYTPTAWAPGSAWGPAATPPANTKAQEKSALGQLRIAAIVNLIGVFASLVLTQIISTVYKVPGVFGLTSVNGATQYSQNWLDAVAAIAGLGFILAAVAWWLVRSALVTFRGLDPGFGTPATLVLLGLIGFVMVALGFFLLIAELGNIVNCAGGLNFNNTTNPSCVTNTLGALLGSLALLGLGAVFAFIGLIGYIWGFWRVGTRYDETVMKVGAILTIIPYVNIVAYILILVGIGSAERKIDARPQW